MDGLKRRLNESIQLKLSFVLSLVITVVAIVAGTFSFLSALDEAYERQDDVLYQVADLVGRLQVSTPEAIRNLELPDQDRDSSLFVRVLKAGAAVAVRSESDGTLPIPPSLSDGLHTLNVRDATFRVLVRTTATGERIVVAQGTSLRDAVARNGALRTLAPFLILVPILLLIIADLVRKMFRPIKELSQEVDARTENDLQPVGNGHLPREVRPFVRAINRLLLRVSQSMEAQRRFVADAAHELRSPMTALSLQAERLGRAEMSGLAHKRLQTLRSGMERNQHLLNQLLALASAQSSADPSGPPFCRVQAVYHAVLEGVMPLAEAKHIDIGVTGSEDAELSVSELDLTTLVRNLTDNAIRYTPEGGRVDLSAVVDHQTATLVISDSGPGIPPAERECIFEPFYRVLGSGQTGSGLGLSIVQAIARRIGAHIELAYADELTRTGLRITITLSLRNRQPGL